MAEVLKENKLPEGISNLVISDHVIGQKMVESKDVQLISFYRFYGCRREVASKVAGRFGKSILELGGNNAIIITENADLEMSIIGAVFGAVGTAGQRCTSTRRLIIHESVYDKVKTKLCKSLWSAENRKSIRCGKSCRSTNR